MAAVGGCLIAAAAAPAAASTTSSQIIYQARPPHVQATMLKHVSPSLTPAECLAQTGGAFACHDPASIHAAYDIPDTVDGAPAGTGQTIVIVDAFGSPTIRSDLQTFDASFGLPDPSLKVIYPQGKPTFHGTANQIGWAEESSLDVQWAHAVAPGANIVLDVATTNYGNALNNAVNYAVTHHLGNVISMSYGEPENLIHGNSTQENQAHKIFAAATKAGITLLASSGDSGSDNGAGYPNFGYPAADPYVTAVGGTDLWQGSGIAGAPRETTWGDWDSSTCLTGCPQGPTGATGGAPSQLTGKNGSDVSYNAGVYTGVLTYLGFLGGANNGLYFFGGTSAGSPQWAGIVAITNQARADAGRAPLGELNTQLATLNNGGAFYDVQEGKNITPTYTGGFSATSGKDIPTGYGSPDAGQILSLLG